LLSGLSAEITFFFNGEKMTLEALPLAGDPWQIGVDEVGRGPWAGPVCAAAVVLGEAGSCLKGLADSKRLTPSRRAQLAEAIHAAAAGVALGWATVAEIDAQGIWPATAWAMCRAVDALFAQMAVDDPALAQKVRARPILVDGNRLPDWPYAAQAVVRGDATVAAIAAASIVAKVARDRHMEVLDAQYPGYGFARHKGYGTAEHALALERLGVSAVHRRSFAPVARWLARAGGAAAGNER
jgi:ribonuclease HII